MTTTEKNTTAPAPGPRPRAKPAPPPVLGTRQCIAPAASGDGECGNTFEYRAEHARFCSPACRARDGYARNHAHEGAKPTVRRCEECGEEFTALRATLCGPRCWRRRADRKKREGRS